MPNIPLWVGGYAITVVCNRQAAAVANFSDSDSAASHNGIAQPADTWYAPAVYDNYYNFYSNIFVRNTTSTAQNVILDIYPDGSSTPVYTYLESIPAYGSRVYYQEYLSQLNANQIYSAKVVSAGSVVTVNIYGRGAVDDQLYSYNALRDSSTEWYAPVIMKNYYGHYTAIVVQNKDTIATEINVQYSNGLTIPRMIQPNSAVSLYSGDIPDDWLPPGNILYSAKIISIDNRQIVVMVNESNSYNRAATYNGFAAGSNTVYASIVLKRYYGFNSSVTCQNVGDANTNMTIDYPYPYGQTTSPSTPPRGNHMFYQLTDPALANAPPNYISSATITASQRIVCVVNQDQNEGGYATTVMDQLTAYNAIAP
jgi:hypothetical protein